MRTSFIVSLVLIAAVCFSTPALAGKNAPLEVGKIVTQQQQIHAEVQAGRGRYKRMPMSQRNELLAKQTHLLGVLEGKRTVADLTEAKQIEVFNTLEWIKATINNAEDERMVCTREAPTGSHRIQKVCRTVAQIREEREAAKDAVDRKAVCSSGDMCTGR